MMQLIFHGVSVILGLIFMEESNVFPAGVAGGRNIIKL